MSENTIQLEKEKERKGNKTSKSSLLKETPRISMPSVKGKMNITDLLPFNLLGNKAELLADSIGGLVEIGANTSDRVIDAFAGTGAYVQYLKDMGFNKPMILNEFDPFRFVTHKQIKDNPLAVSFAAKYYQEKVSNKVKHLKHGDRFDSVAKQARKNVVDYMQKEAERLIQPWQNTTELNKHKLPLKIKNTPESASLYIVMQNQRLKYFPINADTSVKGLKRVMTYGQNKTVANEKGKIKLFRTGGRILRNPRERILSVSKRLQNVDITYGDGWKLIYETAGDRDLVLVDTSYLGKTTENYNQFTQEDSDPGVYMEKVRKYILPAFKRGAKFLVTNNWNDEIVHEFLKLGFTVFKAERAKEQSNGKPELVAINFDPIAGAIYPRAKVCDVESALNRHGTQLLKDQSSSDFKKIGSIQGDILNKTYALHLKSSGKLDAIESSSIHMVVTSPPYVNLRKIGTHPDKYVEWFMPFAKEIKRVLVENGNFILNLNEVIVKGIVHPYVDDLKYELRKIGLNQISKPYVWFKTTAIPNRCSHRAIDRYEYCFWFSNGKGTFYRNNIRRPYSDATIKRVENYDVISLGSRGEKGHKVFKKSKIDPRGALPYNIIELSPECNPRIKHSAPFPIGLPEWFIKAGTAESDTVLDPFMGSGTTAIAALQNNRNVIGYEIDKEVFDYSMERIQKHFEEE